jgi:hypothetical protein
MNFDSGRRIKRLERAKKSRQERNQRRWATIKQAREQQRRLDRMVVTG